MSESKMQKRLKFAYVKAGGQNVALLPELFAMLVQFLKQFLENCNAKDVKELPDAFITRKLIQRSMSEGETRKEAKIVAAAGLETIRKSTASELEAL